MMVMEQTAPELDLHSGNKINAGKLMVEPEAISFHESDPDRVLIRVRVRNAGDGPSRPATARLESAPLGAFVSWQPLDTLLVPALLPGDSVELTSELPRFRAKALAGGDRIPPQALLTALGASPDDSAANPVRALGAMVNWFRSPRPSQAPPRSHRAKSVRLAPDIWDLVGREQPYWAGNVNVFVGAQAVERHRANALRIYPGRSNLAIFMVGGPGQDAYKFGVEGLPDDWEVALHEATQARTVIDGAAGPAIRKTDWLEAEGPMLAMLAIRPPNICREGDIKILVTQRSSQKTARVEFNLNPAAQGPGCYVV